MRFLVRNSGRILLLTGILVLLLSGALQAAEKIKINSLEELPVHTYTLQGTVAELMNHPDQMTQLRKEVRADIDSDLAKYEISDPATLKKYYQTMVLLDLADRKFKAAIDGLDRILLLEDKEANQLMDGLVTRAYIAAHDRLTGTITEDRFLAVFRLYLEDKLMKQPYRVVQDRVKADKARAEFMSENLLLGMVQSQIEPAAKAMGGLSSDLAASLIGIRYTIDERLALNPVIVEVYDNYIQANQVAKENIWPQRELVLHTAEDLEPVVVGIWDSGVDPTVYGDLMFVNPAEILDGIDNDGNGFVDDIYGIAFDVNGMPSTDMLHPLGDQDGKLAEVYEYVQGFSDMTANVDSPAATAVRTHLKNIPADQVGGFMTSLSFGGLYMHGTHVAGIAVKDNPFARILIARISFDYHPTPAVITIDIAKRLAAGYLATAQYFRDNGVRVVNMSWGYSYKEIESNLEANGVGKDGEERAALAKEMIGILGDGLKQAMTDSPGILFVTAAGNDDNDVDFDVVIPSSFDLPNLMVIGALDQAGDPTGFTSGGENVRVYANGFQVESYVPGGNEIKMSGTSMASPNVCNLAAKLVARDPDLTPPEIILLIEQGAEQNPDYPDILRVNPKRSGILLMEQ